MKSSTLALFSRQRRNTARTTTLTNDVGKGQEGGMVAKSLISIKSLVRFSLKFNSSFRQYWKMFWTVYAPLRRRRGILRCTCRSVCRSVGRYVGSPNLVQLITPERFAPEVSNLIGS